MVRSSRARRQGRCGKALIGSVFLLGCGDSLRIDLFAPEPDAGGLDAGSAPLDAAAPLLDASPISPTDARAADGLRLRYDFAGSGTRVEDRAGSAAGRVLGGAALDDSGQLLLDGIDDYVDLPNHTLSSLESATLMTWVTWSGGVCWQRVFDFGTNDAGEDRQGNALTSLFLTPATCSEGGLAAVSERPPTLLSARADNPLAIGTKVQLTVSFDGPRSLLTLYADGVQLASSPTAFKLTELVDVNAWLGRSQWIQDSFAHLRYDEFRIYGRVLSPAEITAAQARGPDVP